MSVAEVRDAYAARAGEYANLFGSIDAAAEPDRDFVLAWAQRVIGPIIDVGCGPGQWTDYLRRNGADIEGVDPVPEFINEARQRYPDAAYRIGRAEQLGIDDGSLGGILAWFSLIHTDPDQIGVPLTEFARGIRPGGELAVGFFEGPELVPFDHAVTTAYFWPVGVLCAQVERAGFVVTATHTRIDPGTRSQGALIARRAP